MIRKLFSKSVLVIFAFSLITGLIVLTDIPIQVQDAFAGNRHKCNCRTVEEEVYDGPRGRTTWGAVKTHKTRTRTREKCDIVWHWNPFYHTGACD